MDKTTRIIDLNIGQFQTLINEVFKETITVESEDLAAPMNTEQAALFLGMPKPTIYYKLKHEALPGILQGGKYFFFKKDLLKWLRNQPKNQKSEKQEIFMNQFIGKLKSKVQSQTIRV
jgi:Helix-turn-helix domain